MFHEWINTILIIISLANQFFSSNTSYKQYNEKKGSEISVESNLLDELGNPSILGLDTINNKAVKIFGVNTSYGINFIRFCGVKWRESWFRRVRIWFHIKFHSDDSVTSYRNRTCNPMYVNDQWKNKGLTRYVKLHIFDRTDVITLDLKTFLLGLISISNKQIFKKLNKNKPVCFQIIFQKYDGRYSVNAFIRTFYILNNSRHKTKCRNYIYSFLRNKMTKIYS